MTSLCYLDVGHLDSTRFLKCGHLTSSDQLVSVIPITHSAPEAVAVTDTTLYVILQLSEVAAVADMRQSLPLHCLLVF